jgi:hypothetical protein
MRIFVSWSGERSRAIGKALKGWLPDVLQQVDIWMSDHDVDAGARWGSELTSVLAEAHFGILCLTPENQNAPWLLFEAGCLAKSATVARVVPYLYELAPSDVPYPLAQFQAVEATKVGTLRLLHTINDAGAFGMSPERLEKLCDKWWPDLKRALEDSRIPAHPIVPARPDREILDEILSLLRNIARAAPTATPAQLEVETAQTIIVDTRGFSRKGGPVHWSHKDQSVSEFLDRIYFALHEIAEIEPYTYGSAWLLRDSRTGRTYDDIGVEYCRTGGRVKDLRPISSVGIAPGDTLEVVRMTDMV